jgi:hypothetical protein
MRAREYAEETRSQKLHSRAHRVNRVGIMGRINIHDFLQGGGAGEWGGERQGEKKARDNRADRRVAPSMATIDPDSVRSLDPNGRDAFPEAMAPKLHRR